MSQVTIDLLKRPLNHLVIINPLGPKRSLALCQALPSPLGPKRSLRTPLRSGSGQIFKFVRVLLISSVRFSNLKRCFLFRLSVFQKMWCDLIPSKCVFLSILHCKPLKRAQNFWRASRANIFSEGASYFVCQTFKLEPGCFLVRGGGLNSDTPVYDCRRKRLAGKNLELPKTILEQNNVNANGE